MQTDLIREKYLNFFAERGHLIMPSAGLIPEKDPSLLFVSAGMVPFKPYFQGATPDFDERGTWHRVTSAQACLRVGDLENVGRTARHNTFFEMLGNFSFGDYFKREAISWAYQLLTEVFGLDPKRLYATVYLDDDQAYNMWLEAGLPAERISRFGESENFWPASAVSLGPNGPCGPCSEIFYDRGPGFGSPDETGPNTGSGDRFVEIWNLVFTQYNRLGPGVLEPLPQQNIDTGMGLYRMSAILQGVRDFYETDTFKPLIDQVAELSGVAYTGAASVGHRVIADHIRAVVMALAQGVRFSNTGRGYVIRRLLRRAAGHGYRIGLREPFLFKLAPLATQLLQGGFPEIGATLSAVAAEIEAEEERFRATLAAGSARLEEILSAMNTGDVVAGGEAFRLHDTYGFPLELTRELAAERGLGLDEAGFAQALAEQRQRAKAHSKFASEIFTATTQILDRIYREHGPTKFVGYDTLEAPAQVLLLLAGNEESSEASEGEEVLALLEPTPFYAEGGGQVSDQGVLEWPGGSARVVEVQKNAQGLYLHSLEVETGVLTPGQAVTARVEPKRRDTERNHTATHLLQAALRAVLGPEVHQAGSLVSPERLRFDFTHPAPLDPTEISRIESLVNQWILSDFPVNWQVMPLEQARATGAMALFGEKYGDQVRVVTVEGSPSRELCGGCHVRRTGEIGSFLIRQEESVSAGIRRIEALTGSGALAFARSLLLERKELAQVLGTNPDNLLARASQQMAELKEQSRTVQKLTSLLAQAQLPQAGGQEGQAGPVRYASQSVKGLAGAGLREVADQLLQKGQTDLILVQSEDQIVVKVSAEGIKKGVSAHKVLQAIARQKGGRGGGKDNLAQGGGFPAEAHELLPSVLEAEISL